MEAKWQQHWVQAKQEWQANKRLQVATIVAGVLVVIWIHVVLNDWRNAKQADARAALTTYQDMQAVASEHEWLERSKSATNSLHNMQARLWRAASEEEAEAKLRDWLQRLAKESGVTISRISVEVAAAPRGLTWRPVHVDIQGQYQAGNWQASLDKMGKSTPPVLVDLEQINVANAGSFYYRINVTAWFVIGDAAVEAQ